jgi:hypothetical protein
MTTSYARSLDPETEPLFVGASWLLEMSSGETFESERTIFDDEVLGAFSVLFNVPSNETAQPQQLRLIERWESATSTESVIVSMDDLPSPDAPLSVPFGGYTLRLDSIYIEPEGADVAWALEGGTQPYGTVWIEIEMRGPDRSITATASPGSQQRMAFEIEGVASLWLIPGRVVHNTVEDLEAFYGVELGQVQELTLDCTVTIPVPAETSRLSFDLTDIPEHDA